MTGRFCNPGVTLESISDVNCPVLPDGFDLSLAGANASKSLADASRIDMSWYWADLPLGTYALSATTCHVARTDYFIPGSAESADRRHPATRSHSTRKPEYPAARLLLAGPAAAHDVGRDIYDPGLPAGPRQLRLAERVQRRPATLSGRAERRNADRRRCAAVRGCLHVVAPCRNLVVLPARLAELLLRRWHDYRGRQAIRVHDGRLHLVQPLSSRTRSSSSSDQETGGRLSLPWARVLESGRRAQHQCILLESTHDLEAGRQPVASEAARNRRRRQPGQVERVRESSPAQVARLDTVDRSGRFSPTGKAVQGSVGVSSRS